jgi:hypothetical protein
MNARQWVCGLAMAAVLACAGGGLVACGGGGAASKFSGIKSKEMPEGETWEGVYYNPVYGYLHLVPNGENIVGRWKRADSSHWGELSGTAEGNVFRFAWTEHRYGAYGPSGDVKGAGVFIYYVPPKKDDTQQKVPPELDGKFSLEDSQDIGDWHCVKQMSVKPDINSINGENPVDPSSKGQQWQ